MKKAEVLLLGILCFLFAGSAPAQNVEYVGSTLWNDVRDVEVVGDYAYCAFPLGLSVLDVSDAASPDFVSQLDLQGGAQAIHVDGSYIYVAWGSGASGGLRIIDSSDPTDLTVAGSYETPGSAGHVFVLGQYAYVTCHFQDTSALEIIDVSDPSSPALAGSYEMPDTVISGVFVSGNYAYIAWHDGSDYPPCSGGLRIINVSNPTNPTFTGSYDMSARAAGVYVSGDYAYVSWLCNVYGDIYVSGFDIVNVTDPTNPTFASSQEEWVGRPRSIIVSGHFAYVSNYWHDDVSIHGWLTIIDVSDPGNPAIASIYEMQGVPMYLSISEECAYVGNENLQILDVSDPYNPILAGSYIHGCWVFEVFVSDSYAYVATRDLRILDVSDPSAPISVGSYETPGGAYSVFVAGDYAYIADGNLHIVNVSDPSNPVYAGDYDTPGGVRAAFISGVNGFIVWETSHSAGFDIIEISNPADPLFLGRYNCGLGDPGGFYVSGDYAYLGHWNGSTGKLLIIDVSDPFNPIYTGRYNAPGGVTGIFVSGDYAFTVWSAGFEIIDISDPALPTRVGGLDMPGWFVRDVAVLDDHAFVAAGHPNDCNLHIIDVADPENPHFAASYDTPGMARGVFVDGDYTYVADESSLLILRFYPETGIEEEKSLPDQFSLQQNYPNPFNASTIIEYDLPLASEVIVEIYDLLGRRIETLIQAEQPAGYHQVVWDAGDHSSGLYFYKIQAGDYVEARKMVLVK